MRLLTSWKLERRSIMQAYQSPPCLYCGATWNPPGAQTCSQCRNLLGSAPPVHASPFAGQASAVPAGEAVPAISAPVTAPGFYRSLIRTFLLALVGSDAYLIWWCFQLLGFARRERFAKSASPWWVLFPFMNLVYISRAFRGIHDGEVTRLGRSSLSLPLANLGFISMLILGRISQNIFGLTGLAIDLTVAVGTAGVLALVQRSANAYQANVHPELGLAPSGMAGRYTWGEVAAVIVGIIITLLLISADLLPN
jgi:hypothetical protein